MPKGKRRATSRPKQKGMEQRPVWKRFLAFVASPVVRRLILVVVVVGLLYWWGAVIWQRLLTLFGFGLVIIAIALGVAVWVVWRGRFRTVAKHWNSFVGGTMVAFAVWGLLSFFGLGGSFCQGIIGTSTIFGVLVIAGLIVLGIIFIAPRKGWRVVKKASRGVWRFLAALPRPRPALVRRRASPRTISPEASNVAAREAKETAAATMIPELRQEVGRHGPILTPSGWQIPAIDILDKPTEAKLDQHDIERRAELIEEALASYGVEGKVVQINTGPTVTQFGVEPGWDRRYKEIKERGKNGNVQVRLEEVSRTRVRVERITSLANDLALALAVSSIRIEAPVPGKSMVGIEVPNTTFGSVDLRSAVETVAFQRAKARSSLAIALGKGAGGDPVAADLTKMPHLLIAGATGSGKTVCLDSIVACLLLHNSPEDVQLIMVDPKRVELVAFNGIPHLAAPVIVDVDQAISALRWLNREMDRRYRLFAEARARNIDGYNRDCHPENKLPYFVLVIDELADLMVAAFDEVEHAICRLAQLARATGIHIIVATQRPSVDVITGLIKANFPTRISFAVSSHVDSRTILDTVGAEKLLGRGDMLYMPTEASRPKRLQGSFVSDAEIERLVNFWAGQRRPALGFIDLGEGAQAPVGGRAVASVQDSLLEEAKRLAREHEHISTSFLQRRLRIGYPRAARLMEALQQEGLVKVSPPESEK
jgi:S-DNA-T family DNA segregation ATPase FtsK/SpoIIIE